MRGYGGGNRGPKQARVARVYEEDEEEEEDEKNQYGGPGANARGDDDGRLTGPAVLPARNGLNARQKQMLKDNQMSGTVRYSATVRRTLPYEVRTAMAVVLGCPQDTGLSEEARLVLEHRLEQSEDEWTRIDPLVSVCKTINTGHCNIYVKEVVPISRWLVARALRCEYALRITGKARIEGLPYDDNEIVVKPYKGHEGAAERYASFGLAALDLEGVAGPDALLQVEAHMLQLGPLSPADVCDPTWLDEQAEVVSALVRGERVAMKPKPRPGAGSVTMY